MSLLEFDPNKRNTISRYNNKIISPKSKRALEILGLTEQDLYYLTREEIIQQGVKDLSDDIEFYTDLKQKHIKNRVDQFLSQAIQLRESIDLNFENKSNSVSQMNNTSLLQKQDQMLRTLQNKQQIEIERQINNEIRLEKIKKKNLEKEQKLQELKRQQEIEFTNRMIEKEKKLKIREQKLLLARAQADQKNEKIMQKLQEEEQKIRMKREKYQQLKLTEKQRRDQMVQEKMQKREHKLLVQQQQIEEENYQRQQEYERKLEQMNQQILEKQTKIKIANEMQEMKAQQKYKIATSIREKSIRDLEDRMMSKEKEMKQRAAQMEYQRQLEFENRKNKEMMKQKNIVQLKQEQEQQIINKNNSYTQAEQQWQMKKLLLDLQKKRQIQENSALNQSRIEEVQQQQKSLSEQQNNYLYQQYLEKQELTDKAEQARLENIRKMKRKYIIDLLKLEDVTQNNQILQRKNDYKNKQMLERLDETDRRQKMLLLEQQKLMDQKKQMEQKLEQDKQKILSEFETKKAQYMQIELEKSSKAFKTDRTVKKVKSKNQSASSFHLPQTEQPKHSSQASDIKSTTHMRNRPTLIEKQQSKSIQKKQYFINEETMKALQIYANGQSLKAFNIEVRPRKRKHN